VLGLCSHVEDCFAIVHGESAETIDGVVLSSVSGPTFINMNTGTCYLG
jgi:hypothetical protein